jgi:hypothetical protein
VNEHFSHPVESENTKASLVERLDPSIGELSSVMGAMMTELLRRTLRDSVRQIDDELEGRAAQKLDATIAHRMPVIEQSATEAATRAARETATDVAVEKALALELAITSTAHELTSRIEDTAKTATTMTEEKARVLARQIETTARMAEQQRVETANTLAGKIEQVDKKAELAITSTAQELTGRIEDTAKTATTRTEEKAQELARQIEEAERRATGTAQAEVTRQIEEVLQRTRKTTAAIKDRLQVMETTAGILKKQVQEQELARRTSDDHFRVELAEARKRNATLEARVMELEKPRGLHALWAWLFGRRKKQPKQPAAESENTEAMGSSGAGKVSVPKAGELSKSERK